MAQGDADNDAQRHPDCQKAFWPRLPIEETLAINFEALSGAEN